MYVLLIAAILLAFGLPPVKPPAFFEGWFSFLATWALALSVPLAGFLVVNLARRALAHPKRASRIWFFQAASFGYRVLLLGGYATSLHFFGWSYLVLKRWPFGNWVLVGEVLVLAPFLLSVIVSLVPGHRLEMAFRNASQTRRDWPWRDYLLFHMRHHILVVLLPWLLYVSVSDLLRFLPGFAGKLTETTWGELSSAAVLVFVINLVAPLGLSVIFSTERFPEGRLRQRLFLLADRLGLKVRDVLLWRTGNGDISNAFVAGLFGPLRYVFLSDALIARLEEDEVEAVFGHEAAHIKTHQMAFYFVFALSFIFVVWAAEILLGKVLGLLGSKPANWEAMLVAATTALLYWGVLFGYISRRLERGCDLWGAKAIGGIGPMARALEKIGRAEGWRSGRSWRHFGIARRVEDLRIFEKDSEVERRWLRETIGALVIAFVVIAVSLIAVFHPGLGDALKS